MDALERSFWALDEKLAHAVHVRTQHWWLARSACSLVSLSGDEVVWFVLPVVLASLGAVARGGPQAMSCREVSCGMELALDLFGGMAVCAVVEQLAKLFFQRPRPVFRRQTPRYHCIWGEWYSFPSGHTLRAFYLVSWVCRGPHAALALGPGAASLGPAMVAWACAVAVSRIAAGRHHPVDVCVGAMLGSVLGKAVEGPVLDDPDRAALKALCGVSVAVQVWFLLIGPLSRDLAAAVVGRRGAWAAVAAVGAAYFAFYGAALLTAGRALVFESEECVAGRFSHLMVDGVWQCREQS